MKCLDQIGQQLLQSTANSDLQVLADISNVFGVTTIIIFTTISLYLIAKLPKISTLHVNLRILTGYMFLSYNFTGISTLLSQVSDNEGLQSCLIFLKTIGELSLALMAISMTIERWFGNKFLDRYEAFSSEIGCALVLINLLICIIMTVIGFSEYENNSQAQSTQDDDGEYMDHFYSDASFCGDITKLVASFTSLLFLSTLQTQKLEFHNFNELSSLGARYQSKENFVTIKALKLIFVVIGLSALVSLPFSMMRSAVWPNSHGNKHLEEVFSSILQFINQSTAITIALIYIKFLPSLRKHIKSDFCSWRPKHRSAIYASMEDTKLTNAIYDTQLHFHTLQSIWDNDMGDRKLLNSRLSNYI